MLKWILLTLGILIGVALFANYYQPAPADATYGQCHTDLWLYMRCAGGFWKGVLRFP